MNSKSLQILATGCFAVACAALLCSCSTTSLPAKTEGKDSVRQVDFSNAPQLKELTGHARELGNEMYPKICALLLDETDKPLPRFDLVAKPLKSHNTGEAHLEAKRIYLNSDYFTNKADLQDQFDKVFVHEMTHMAVQYRPWLAGFWHSDSSATGYWCESVADFARFKLLGTNGWACPECNARHPHYTSGYSCGGAFLLYLDTNYGTNLVRQLVRELRRHSYTDEFFATATGKGLDELWAEFQKTPAFKPIAADVNQLQQALGYKSGIPPKNVRVRFEKFVAEHANDFTKTAIKSTYRNGKLVLSMNELTGLYLYLTQPGGSAEEFVYNLGKKDELPGKAKGEKGGLTKFLSFEEMESRTFPVSRTIDFQKAGDAARCHYTVSRAAPECGWKLERAWRTATNGITVEEFRVP